MNRKPIFDAVRHMLGRSFAGAEVSALDDAIDHAEASLPASAAPQDLPPVLPHEWAAARAIGAKGLALVKRFEGCAKMRPDGKLEAYPDPGTGGKPWTIGWGATGPGIEPGTVWTQQQADDRLKHDLISYAAAVTKAIGTAPTTQDQFDALVAWHYNTGAIAGATLTKKHVAGDYAGAKAEFGKWVRAGGKVLTGLVKRRAAEAELYAS